MVIIVWLISQSYSEDNIKIHAERRFHKNENDEIIWEAHLLVIAVSGIAVSVVERLSLPFPAIKNFSAACSYHYHHMCYAYSHHL